LHCTVSSAIYHQFSQFLGSNPGQTSVFQELQHRFPCLSLQEISNLNFELLKVTVVTLTSVLFIIVHHQHTHTHTHTQIIYTNIHTQSYTHIPSTHTHTHTHTNTCATTAHTKERIAHIVILELQVIITPVAWGISGGVMALNGLTNTPAQSPNKSIK